MQMDGFDNFLRVRVRDVSLFTCRLTSVAVDVAAGVFALVGKLKSNMERSGYARGEALICEYMFDTAKGWTPERANAWIADHCESAHDANSQSVKVDAAMTSTDIDAKIADLQHQRDALQKKIEEICAENRSNQPDDPRLKDLWNQLDNLNGEIVAFRNAKVQAEANNGSASQGKDSALEPSLVLAHSRKLLCNMPKGRTNVMTSTRWGARHHDGAQ
jgi:hypothetical protein